MTKLIYPEHKHPHGINVPENECRIWVCEDCMHLFSDKMVRAFEGGWGHPCLCHPVRKGQRCESHLEPYLPELSEVG